MMLLITFYHCNGGRINVADDAPAQSLIVLFPYIHIVLQLLLTHFTSLSVNSGFDPIYSQFDFQIST